MPRLTSLLYLLQGRLFVEAIEINIDVGPKDVVGVVALKVLHIHLRKDRREPVWVMKTQVPESLLPYAMSIV